VHFNCIFLGGEVAEERRVPPRHPTFVVPAPPAPRTLLACEFLLLLILFLLELSARATVIVYKGVGRSVLPAAVTQLSAAPRAYYVVDLTANTGYFIHYYTIQRVKGSQVTFPLNNTRYLAQAISATKTVGTFTYVEDASFGSGIGVNMVYLRGTAVTLQLSTIGGGTFASYPKTLAGLFRSVQKVGPTATLFELNYALTFDAPSTQLANNTFKSGATTATDLLNLLSLQGY
jgi:hypothetical protein